MAAVVVLRPKRDLEHPDILQALRLSVILPAAVVRLELAAGH
jgi:hypothetical protein